MNKPLPSEKNKVIKGELKDDVFYTFANNKTEAQEIGRELIEMGLPGFPTFERAARALKNVTEYHAFHRASS